MRNVTIGRQIEKNLPLKITKDSSSSSRLANVSCEKATPITDSSVAVNRQGISIIMDEKIMNYIYVGIRDRAWN